MNNNKAVRWGIRTVLAVLLAVATGAPAEPWAPEHFRGVINDYTPSTVMPMGPWEIRGPWSLRLKCDSTKAEFSAALTMELSDYTRNPTNVDTTSGPGSRGQHTHHIAMDEGTVTQLSGGGFEVIGPVTITKDGSPAPLGASTLVIDITGGTTVEFSNITLTFQGGAPVHFGSQPIHGVVRKTD